MKLKKKGKFYRGFTIVELVVVIVVLGILAGIVTISYVGWQASTRATSLKSDLIGLSIAMENYRNFNGSYPTSVEQASFIPSNGNKISIGVTDSDSGGYYANASDSNSIATYSITNTNTTPQASNYFATIGLAGWWQLNGNGDDSSGNGHTLSLNAVTPDSDKNSVVNHAYSLNGSTSYIGLGSASSSAYNFPNITMASWVKRNSISGTQNIFGKEGQYKYRFNGSNDHIDILVSSPSGNAAWESPSANKCNWNYPVSYPAGFTPGTWYHIAVTINSSTLTATAYVNGSSIGTCTFYSAITGYGGSQFYAGVTSPGYEPFSGSLDDLRIYNRVLNQSEIQAIYNSPAL